MLLFGECVSVCECECVRVCVCVRFCNCVRASRAHNRGQWHRFRGRLERRSAVIIMSAYRARTALTWAHEFRGDKLRRRCFSPRS